MRYRLSVISLRVTLDLKLRGGPNRGMRYKQEVCVSLRSDLIRFCIELVRSNRVDSLDKNLALHWQAMESEGFCQ